MEIPWFIIISTLCITFLLKSLINLIQNKSHTAKNLPPGPPALFLITDFQWLRKNSIDFEHALRGLRAKFGPIFTLRLGRRRSIFIASHDLAHQTLITRGGAFSDRPPAPASSRLMSSNQHNISSAPYGPLWRLLRRNLTAEILHPSRVRSYGHARNWVLNILIQRLKSHQSSGGVEPTRVVDHFQYAMFCLLCLMCFGEKLEEGVIREVEGVMRDVLLNFGRLSVLAFFPRLSRLVFPNRWAKLYELKSERERVLIPLIRARGGNHEGTGTDVIAYVDTLIGLRIPEDGGRRLSEEEIVSLCSEFLNAGTDTTSTALQWIMANLVKHQDVQEKVFDEIQRVVGEGEELREEDLQRMTYLKAVVLEGLRRHPPGHFVLPHAVVEEVEVEGFVVPKGVSVNFMVAEMGWDKMVWDDPMEFKPERFLKEGFDFDITGSREIKMMPFGAGRRICPGLGLALLHLEYFVANLVREFKWTAREGDVVDLSEKQEFTIVMKHPLWAHLTPRKA
ncbi:hypothetical protein Sjap_004029 [Stephania japonica]|uniref:Cytochrome P450 n=1 Tax=Stephania japonica TaxID=461633 RepID=A0AAP0K1P3_9MAGN